MYPLASTARMGGGEGEALAPPPGKSKFLKKLHGKYKIT